MNYYKYKGNLYRIDNGQVSSFAVFSDKYTGWVTTMIENNQKINQENRIRDIIANGIEITDLDKEVEKYKMMETLKV